VESGTNPGYSPSAYAETSAVDGNLNPNETLNPDYSGSDATYLGTVTHNGQVFLVFSDEFGQLLGAPNPGLGYTDWPAEVDPDNIVPTVTPICFLSGTLIATPSHDVLVEDLQIGDQIVTAEGHRVYVKWIGHQSFHMALFSMNVQPVRISKGALGGGLPHSDLTVTADHGMILDGLVINASALVNGTTIDFVPLAELPESVTYYHVETEAHEVILANGAAAETFMDAAGRGVFDNHQDYLELYGVGRIIPEMPRPRINAQRLLPDAIKARLGVTDVTEMPILPRTA